MVLTGRRLASVPDEAPGPPPRIVAGTEIPDGWRVVSHHYQPQRHIFLVFRAAERQSAAAVWDIFGLVHLAVERVDPFGPIPASGHIENQGRLLAAVQVDGIRLPALRQHERGPAGGHAAFDERSVRLHVDEVDALHEVLENPKLLPHRIHSPGLIPRNVSSSLWILNVKGVIKIIRFQQAVQWLEQRFPAPAGAQPTPPAPKSALILPPPDPAKLWQVQQYLIRQRHIPPALVESLVQAGTLYADHRANAVFLLLGKENNPVGAELRGTTSRSWHGLAPGSQKDRGFFSIPTAPRSAIILVESAIDAISCFALHPQHRCISTAGARPNPRWLVPLLDQGDSVYCGFDADPTGESMARAMIARHPLVQRLCPAQHDWNDVLKAQA